MENLARLRHKQKGLFGMRQEGSDHVIAGSQLDAILGTIGQFVHIQPQQFPFKRDKAKEVFFLAEGYIEWMVRLLQRAFAQIMISKNGLCHRCHRFLHTSTATDLQEELRERQARDWHQASQKFSGSRFIW